MAITIDQLNRCYHKNSMQLPFQSQTLVIWPSGLGSQAWFLAKPTEANVALTWATCWDRGISLLAEGLTAMVATVQPTSAELDYNIELSVCSLV